jgi:DNA topoisomerase-1
MFINVPRRYDFDNLTQSEMDELIEAKRDKEANRYIRRWDEEKITIENARWGPVIKFGKKIIYLPKKPDGARATAEEAASLSLEDVKQVIESQVPGAFAKKTRTPAKRGSGAKAARK